MKEKSKKNIIYIILGVLLLALICLIVFKILLKSNDNTNDSIRFKNDYESLNETLSQDDREYPSVSISTDNVAHYSNIEEIIDLFNSNKDGVVYFGEPSCIYCRSAVQVLIDTSLDTEIDKIYYLDTSKVNKGNNNYITLLEKLGSDLLDNNEINIPLVIFITDGQIVSYNIGTLFSQTDAYTPLDKWQIMGLGEIYKNGINNVVESLKIKNLIS